MPTQISDAARHRLEEAILDYGRTQRLLGSVPRRDLEMAKKAARQTWMRVMEAIDALEEAEK